MMTRKRFGFAFWVLACLIVVALARDFLANGRPLYCRIGEQSYWPGLRTVWLASDIPYQDSILESIRINGQWKTYPYDRAVFAPIPFSPGELIRKPPAERAHPGSRHPGLPDRFRHWLGTDDRGRDIAAGLVSGARIAVLTGLTAMAVALSIGLFLGAIAGYFGDDRLRVRKGRFWVSLLGVPVAWFYAFAARQYVLGDRATLADWVESFLIFTIILLIFNGLGWLIARMNVGKKIITLPADLLIMRLAEVFSSIPKLIFIIVVAAILPKDQSIWLMIALIGAMSWPGVARFVRADLLKVRELDYVSAARGLGFSDGRILLRHALPNAIRSTLVAFAIGGAEAIMLEATLSFLGFGGDQMQGKSWGSLLNSARAYPLDWWVSLPPGIIICMTVLALNAIAESLSERKSR